MSEDNLDNLAPDASPSDAPDQESIITSTDSNEVKTPQVWPDDWRDQMAGGDEKSLTQLARINSPNDMFKSYRALQAKMSSQKPVIEAPGADSTDEEVKAYRESIGIPDDPSGYNLDMEDGSVIGEDIKGKLDGYLKHAHDSNLHPDVVKSTVSWFMNDVEAQQESIRVANDEARINGITELKAEWGGEFQGNMNAIHSLFTNAPEGTMDNLLGSVGPDGLKFANNPDNIRWLSNLAREANPTATLVPPGPDQASSISAEIEKIESIMHSPDRVESKKYWNDPEMQSRYVKLKQAQQG
jgi:hypothetical protein